MSLLTQDLKFIAESNQILSLNFFRKGLVFPRRFISGQIYSHCKSSL